MLKISDTIRIIVSILLISNTSAKAPLDIKRQYEKAKRYSYSYDYSENYNKKFENQEMIDYLDSTESTMLYYDSPIYDPDNPLLHFKKRTEFKNRDQEYIEEKYIIVNENTWSAGFTKFFLVVATCLKYFWRIDMVMLIFTIFMTALNYFTWMFKFTRFIYRFLYPIYVVYSLLQVLVWMLIFLIAGEIKVYGNPGGTEAFYYWLCEERKNYWEPVRSWLCQTTEPQEPIKQEEAVYIEMLKNKIIDFLRNYPPVIFVALLIILIIVYTKARSDIKKLKINPGLITRLLHYMLLFLASSYFFHFGGFEEATRMMNDYLGYELDFFKLPSGPFGQALSLIKELIGTHTIMLYGRFVYGYYVFVLFYFLKILYMFVVC